MESSTDSPHHVKARHREISAAPFCWAAKPALRKIRDAFDSTNDVASALGVYLALCEVASDAGSAEFTTTHAWLQSKSGWSIRTIRARLPQLAEIGVIAYTTPTLKAPSTFKLLQTQSEPQPLQNDRQPLQDELQRKKAASLQPLEERERKIEERTKKEPAPSSLQEIYSVYPKKVGKPAALRAIQAAVKKHNAAMVLDKTKAFATRWGSELKYCPNPSTWFNEERFLDDPETWGGKKSKRADSVFDCL